MKPRITLIAVVVVSAQPSRAEDFGVSSAPVFAQGVRSGLTTMNWSKYNYARR